MTGGNERWSFDGRICAKKVQNCTVNRDPGIFRIDPMRTMARPGGRVTVSPYWPYGGNGGRMIDQPTDRGSQSSRMSSCEHAEESGDLGGGAVRQLELLLTLEGFHVS